MKIARAIKTSLTMITMTTMILDDGEEGKLRNLREHTGMKEFEPRKRERDTRKML